MARYARTVGGNWTDNATWSTTSGGAADTVAPTASDDVFLDANSGNVTISAASVGKSLTCTGYTGTLTHNGFALTISGSVTFVAGMTYTTTATANYIAFNASGTFTSAGKTPRAILVSAGTLTLGDNLTFKAQKVTDLTISGSAGLNLNGFTISGDSSVNRVLILSGTLGTAKTITNTTGTFANADFRDITFSTVADYSAITGGSGDCGGNTNATFTTAADQHWISASGGNWSDVTKWTSRVPLPQDNVYFDNAFSASQTVTADMPRLGKSIDWTGASGSPTWADSVANTLYGSLTLISGMTHTFNDGTTYEGRGTHTITSAGKSFSGVDVIQAFGGTYTLQDAYTKTANNFRFLNGTLNTNGFTLTLTSQFDTATSNTRVLNLGASTISFSGTGTTWNMGATGMTLSAGTSTILISDTSASSKTFAGGGLTYNNLQIAGGGAGAVIITGSNSFNRLPQIAGGTKTLQITAGTTQTFRSVGVEGFGNGSNVITIQSTSGGSTYTFSRASGIVSADYLSLQDSIATGGAEWYAGANSTNVSGNTGWYFTVPQTVSSENLTKAGTSWVWGLDPNSYAYGALLQQEWVPSSSNATIGNHGLLTAAHLRQTYGNLTFFKDYGSASSSVDADYAAGSPTGTWTVTRSATTPATTIDSQGRIQIVQHNGPRFTSGFYDSTGFVSRPGLLVEGASTNLLKDSYINGTFATYWRALATGTVTQDSTYTNPYGGGTIGKLVSSAQNDGFQTAIGSKFSVTNTTVYTVSALVRGTGTAKTYFKSDTVAASYGSVVTLDPTKWILIQGQHTAGASELANAGIVSNDGTSTIYIAYIQCEALPFASTFIPTTTAALTRNAEALTYPISGNRTAASESVFFKYTPLYNPTTITNYQALIDTVTKRRYMTQFHSGVGSTKIITKANGTDDTTKQVILGSDVTQFTSTVIAATYQHSSPYIAAYKDGSSSGTDWTASDWTNPAWGSTMHIGHSQAGIGNEQLYGIISSIAIFSDAKSAGDVASITRTLQ